MAELPQLRLPTRHSKPCAHALRQFFVRVLAYRSALALPEEETLSWDLIGVVPPDETVPPAATSLQTLLKRAKLSLALPGDVFKKPGGFAQRLRVVAAKAPKFKLTWSVYAVQHSQAFTTRALEHPTERRVEIVHALRGQGACVWDKQFVWTAVAEARQRPTGYHDEMEVGLQGRTKKSIQDTMMELDGCKGFFAQHATLLLTGGGSVVRAQKMGITDLEDTVVIGDGGHRILHLITEEYLGFPVQLTASDYDKLALRERPRWRAAGLAAGLQEKQLPLCLQKSQGGGHHFRRWVLLPESFGDLLCEAAKTLRVLIRANGAALKPMDSSGWSAPCGRRDNEAPCVAKRRRCAKGPE
jgi:hypothetical protein